MAYDLRAFARDLGGIDKAVAIKVGAATRKAASDVQKLAKQAAPVDTGRLKSGIGIDSSTAVDTLSVRNGGTQTVEVGPTAFYGGLVEQGTSRQGPRPYLGPAFDRVAPTYEAAVSAILTAAGL